MQRHEGDHHDRNSEQTGPHPVLRSKASHLGPPSRCYGGLHPTFRRSALPPKDWGPLFRTRRSLPLASAAGPTPTIQDPGESGAIGRLQSRQDGQRVRFELLAPPLLRLAGLL